MSESSPRWGARTRDDGYEAIPNDPSLVAERESAAQSHISEVNSSTIRTKRLPHGGTFTILPTPDSKHTNYTYAYGPSGLPGLLRNPYALGSAIFASIGGLSFGYDQGVIANVLVMDDFTRRWPVGEWEIGFMTAMLELGALLGALLAGTFSDHYSRRHSIFAACVVFIFGSTLQATAASLSDLTVGRGIGGIGIGALSMLSPLYMAEISPPELRGSLMSLEQFAIVLGVVIGFWTGFWTKDVPGELSWRIPLGIQILPGLLLAVGCFFLPESPRLMVMQGRDDEAMKSLTRLRLPNGEDDDDHPLLQIELLEMKVEARLVGVPVPNDLQMELDVRTDSNNNVAGNGVFQSELAAWARLFSRKYIRRTSIGIFMMFFQQWSGINALLYYGPILMRRIGLGGNSTSAALAGAGGIGIVQFLAVFPAILYIDKLGRKLLLICGGVAMALSYLMAATLIWFNGSDWKSHTVAAWSTVICLYAFTAAYGLSYGPVAWILPNEVLPLSIRSKGAAAATASNWINNFIIGLITPALISALPSGTFLIFAFACILATVWVHYYVPETANIPLEEMDRLFGGGEAEGTGVEEAEQKRLVMQEVGLDKVIEQLIAETNEG